METRVADIKKELTALAVPSRLEHMAKYGINTEKALGCQIPDMRSMGRKLRKELGRDGGKLHRLAAALWDEGTHELRILASMVDDPGYVDEPQMEAWVLKFNSWDLCDQVIQNLFEKTVFAYDKAFAWSRRDGEFVRRAGFVLMARLAVSDKKQPDERFEEFFPDILEGCLDERNMVKKAVNWAVRQIGKRSRYCNAKAVALAGEILARDSKSARWIARDALRELKDPKVLARLER